jgi:hypothetical protein
LRNADVFYLIFVERRTGAFVRLNELRMSEVRMNDAYCMSRTEAAIAASEIITGRAAIPYRRTSSNIQPKMISVKVV